MLNQILLDSPMQKMPSGNNNLDFRKHNENTDFETMLRILITITLNSKNPLLQITIHGWYLHKIFM